MIPKKILVCTDFSENSVKARLLAISYAQAFEAELIVLHVINSRLIGYPTFVERVPMEVSALQKSIDEGARQQMELITSDTGRTIEQTTGHVIMGAPAEEIVRFANDNDVDLIVMGTHGWTGVKRIIIGSTAENVLRTALCPVLVVRSDSE